MYPFFVCGLAAKAAVFFAFIKADYPGQAAKEKNTRRLETVQKGCVTV